MTAGSSRVSSRRNSLMDSIVHRLSVDLGVISDLGPDGAPLSFPQGLSQVWDEEHTTAAIPRSVSVMQVIHVMQTTNHPVPLWYHTYKSNMEGLVSATPALALILGSKLLVDWLASKGGPWGDTMGARCTVCIAGVELLIMGLNYMSPGYVKKRLLLGKGSHFIPLHSPTCTSPPYTLHSGIPAQIAFSALLSYTVFDWKPGMWTPLMMTFSFWLSMIAHFPLNEEETPFLQHVGSTFTIALVAHLGVVGFVFAIVIPTRLLVRSTPSPSPTPLNR
jgi:hypothetical protein